MTFEQAMLILDIALQQKHLTNIQELVLRQSWEGYTYAQIAESSGYDDDYIRDVGFRLWQTISKALGENVNKSNIKSVLRRRYSSLSPVELEAYTTAPKGKQRQDWGEAIDVSIFYGRKAEQAKLQQWIINDKCRLIALLGMGGIGKTALSVKLAEQLQGEFNYVIWRSLRNAPPIVDLLREIILFVSDQQEVNLPETVDKQISCLMKYLRSQRCLIVLDNAESILESGKRSGRYRSGYQEYGHLFRRVGDERHQSCLVFTSREKPSGFTAREGATLPVRSLQLTGLPQAEAQQIITSKGLVHSATEYDNLIQRYTGNPLALKIVATTIQRLFDGDVRQFLQQGPIVFGDIWEILEQQFNRLSANEKQVMYWLAIKREWVKLTQLQEDIVPKISKRELLEALLSLQGRSLIEQHLAGYSQQPVVMEYVTDKLIKQICRETITGEIELFNTHALIEATAKDYVRESQKRVILKPILNKLKTSLRTSAAIEQRLKKIIARLRDNFSAIPGYGGGNAINLLRQMKVDLTGYNFSGLTIWQADFQGVNLHQVNFRNTDIRKSTFTEAIVNVLWVEFSPDGKLLATGDANGGVRLWNVIDGRQLQNFDGHIGWVRVATFSPNSQTLASCSDDGIIKLWDVSTGMLLHTLEQDNVRCWSVRFSSDGTLLASGRADNIIKLWDVSSGHCLKTLQGHTDMIRQVAFSKNGAILASASLDTTVKLWDVSTGECWKTLQGHTQAVWSIAFSPDGRTLASGSKDNTVKLWNVNTGECWKTLQGSQIEFVWSVAFSPDAQILAIAKEASSISFWDVQTGQCIQTLSGHTSRVSSVTFSPDGRFLASAAEDQTIRLWEVATGRCIKTFQGYPSFVWAVAFSPDGESLAANTSQLVRLWDIATGKCLKTFHGHRSNVTALVFSSDGQTLFSSSLDQTIRVWHISKGQGLRTLEGHTGFIFSLFYSPDGKTLASGSADSTIKLWDVKTGQCLKTLQEHTGFIFSLSYSPDGNTLASGSADSTIKLWNVPTEKIIQEFKGHQGWIYAIAFSPDGHTLVSGGIDLTLKLWDIKTGDCRQTLSGHSKMITSVKFSPQGDQVVSVSQDLTIKIWDVHTGECLNTLHGHTNWIWDIAFDPNGQIFATGSQDETVRLWDITTGECLQILRSPRPYEGMNIQGVIGLSKAQKASLKILGAVE